MSLVIGDPSEGPVDAIVKLIPGETVFLYTAVSTVDEVASSRLAAATLLVLGVMLAPLVLWLSARRSRNGAPAGQYLVRTLAFVAWAFTASNRLLELEARWITAVAVVAIPVIGSFLFPPGGRPR